MATLKIDSQILSRKKFLYLAKLAGKSGRYKDVMNYMKNLVTIWISPASSDLTSEERKLLFSASSEVINSLRTAWRSCKSVSRDSVEHKQQVEYYQAKIEVEISDVCIGILELLDKILIPSASSEESKVAYLKSKGDYERYLAELKDGTDDFKLACDKSLESYKAAQKIALVEITGSHPVRLDVAVSLADFYNDLLDSTETAYDIASLAGNDAKSDIDSMNLLPPELYRESLRLQILIRDNLLCNFQRRNLARTCS